MKRYFILMASVLMFGINLSAQNVNNEGKKLVYDETINPMEQIDNAIAKAKKSEKYVVCQVGGNWCPWCLRFADIISKDSTISKTINDNFEYIHVNYPRGTKNVNEEVTKEVMKRLGNPARFGFPVLVILNTDGSVLHIQNTVYLEEDKSYNIEKVRDFFAKWTPKAVKGE